MDAVVRNITTRNHSTVVQFLIGEFHGNRKKHGSECIDSSLVQESLLG